MHGHLDLSTPLGKLRAFARYETHGGYRWAAVMCDAEVMCEACVRENYRQVYQATQAWMRVKSVRESHAFPPDLAQWAVIDLTNSGESESAEVCANCNKILWSNEP